MLQTGSVINVSKTTNPRWTAPEVILNSQIGPAADVYSFAIVMWEMLTWLQPYEDMMSVQVIFSTVSDHNRPDIPEDDAFPGSPGVTLSQYKELMISCWSGDARIVDLLSAMKLAEDQAAPPKASKAAKKDIAAKMPSAPLVLETDTASPMIVDLKPAPTAPTNILTHYTSSAASETIPAASETGRVRDNSFGDVSTASLPGQAADVTETTVTSYNPFGDESEAPFPSNTDLVFETTEASYNPFGDASEAPFPSNTDVVSETTEASYNPFGDASAAPFPSNTDMVSETAEASYNPFGDASAAPFPSNTDVVSETTEASYNPFGDASAAPFSADDVTETAEPPYSSLFGDASAAPHFLPGAESVSETTVPPYNPFIGTHLSAAPSPPLPDNIHKGRYIPTETNPASPETMVPAWMPVGDASAAPSKGVLADFSFGLSGLQGGPASTGKVQAVTAEAVHAVPASDEPAPSAEAVQAELGAVPVLQEAVLTEAVPGPPEPVVDFVRAAEAVHGEAVHREAVTVKTIPGPIEPVVDFFGAADDPFEVHIASMTSSMPSLGSIMFAGGRRGVGGGGGDVKGGGGGQGGTLNFLGSSMSSLGSNRLTNQRNNQLTNLEEVTESMSEATSEGGEDVIPEVAEVAGSAALCEALNIETPFSTPVLQFPSPAVQAVQAVQASSGTSDVRGEVCNWQLSPQIPSLILDTYSLSTLFPDAQSGVQPPSSDPAELQPGSRSTQDSAPAELATTRLSQSVNSSGGGLPALEGSSTPTDPAGAHMFLPGDTSLAPRGSTTPTKPDGGSSTADASLAPAVPSYQPTTSVESTSLAQLAQQNQSQTAPTGRPYPTLRTIPSFGGSTAAVHSGAAPSRMVPNLRAPNSSLPLSPHVVQGPTAKPSLVPTSYLSAPLYVRSSSSSNIPATAIRTTSSFSPRASGSGTNPALSIRTAGQPGGNVLPLSSLPKAPPLVAESSPKGSSRALHKSISSSTCSTMPSPPALRVSASMDRIAAVHSASLSSKLASPRGEVVMSSTKSHSPSSPLSPKLTLPRGGAVVSSTKSLSPSARAGNLVPIAKSPSSRIRSGPKPLSLDLDVVQTTPPASAQGAGVARPPANADREQ
eukprot:gene18549-25056_t